MSINIEDVNYIARLSKLRFTEDEAKVFAKEFENILEQFKTIDKLELDKVEDVKSKISIIREDIDQKCEIEELLSNVKTMRDTYIEVPKIIE